MLDWNLLALESVTLYYLPVSDFTNDQIEWLAQAIAQTLHLDGEYSADSLNEELDDLPPEPKLRVLRAMLTQNKAREQLARCRLQQIRTTMAIYAWLADQHVFLDAGVHQCCEQSLLFTGEFDVSATDRITFVMQCHECKRMQLVDAQRVS